MTAMKITPEDAKTLIDQGAKLIDVREADEHARENIPGASLMPLSELGGHLPSVGDADTVIFHCRSGGRTEAAAEHLEPATGQRAFILDGGIDAWRKTGLPVDKDRRQPIELMRQVQIAAGALTLGGVVGGAVLHPALYGIAGFVGAGLMFAGATGFCGMARVLVRMPWNRPRAPLATAKPLAETR